MHRIQSVGAVQSNRQHVVLFLDEAVLGVHAPILAAREAAVGNGCQYWP
jgi:hypothetical protein